MSDLTAKFGVTDALITSIGDEAQSQRASIEVTLEDIQSGLASINSDLILMRNALLSSIGVNSPCAPCPTPSLTVPPTNSTSVPLDSDHCKRVQAFLAYMSKVFTVLDTMSAFAIPFSPSLISDAFAQVIADFTAGDTIPLPSFPESVQIVGDGINYVAGNFLVGGTLVANFSAMTSAMLPALNLSGSASAVQSQYEAIIDGSATPSYAKPLMKDAAYNAIYSYFFDPTSLPDLTPYDGSACGGSLIDAPACVTLDSIPVTFEGHVTEAIQAAPAAAPNLFYIGGDFFGWTVTVTAGDPARGVDIYRTTDGSNSVFTHGFNPGSPPFVINAHGLAFAFVAHDPDFEPSNFSMQFCPPS